MPTLLQINPTDNLNSTGKIANDIGLLAIEDGWKSYITHRRNDIIPGNNTPIRVGNTFDFYCHVLETRLFDNPGLGYSSYFSTRKLIRTIQDIKPDIIHLHIIHGYYLNLNLLFRFLKAYGKPIVWTIHSCWEFTGHCAYFDNINCRKWMTGCSNCPQRHLYPKSWFRDRSRTNFDEKKKLFTGIEKLTIVPVSDWLEHIVKQSFFQHYPRLAIYNGIDTSIFAPSDSTVTTKERLRIENNFMVIAVASVWEQRKNLEDYLLLSQLLPEDVRLVLVGLPEKTIKTLPRGVIGLPRTSNVQELVDLYSAADVVLNLSLEETFGMTTVEGMACGTPGIVYDKTASPELISPETGFVVKAGNIAGVRDAILHIKQRGRAAYQDHCRERAVTCYNKNHNLKKYIDLYRKLL